MRNYNSGTGVVDMEASERRRLYEMSAQYSADLAEHGALWDAWRRASEESFRGRLMGVVGEEALNDAKKRLHDWEVAKQWNPPERGVSEEKSALPAELAAQIAAGG